jgi:ABC-type transport system substrate-binding protein
VRGQRRREISIKDKQYAGSIPGEYLVRSNEHDYDTGSKYKGRFGTPQGSYISYDSELQTIIDEALAVVDPEKRADAYYKMHKAVHEKHYDFAPGYLNATYGVSNEIAEWEPWPMKVHPSALWTIRFK